jgi:hypothetical protein
MGKHCVAVSACRNAVTSRQLTNPWASASQLTNGIHRRPVSFFNGETFENPQNASLGNILKLNMAILELRNPQGMPLALCCGNTCV